MAKTREREALQAIHAQRERLSADLGRLETASASTWDAAKANTEKELADLKMRVDKS